MKKQLLFLDDEPAVLDALRRMLRSYRDRWEITCMTDPRAAWHSLLENSFDVVVSDIQMHGVSGLELLERMRQHERLRDIPVVMVTGLATRGLKRRVLRLGAADLLNKPIEPEDLVARLTAALRLKAYQDGLKANLARLEQRVEDRTRDLCHARLNVLWRLGKAAEYRDNATGSHIIRVGCASRLIAESLQLSRDFVENIFLAAPLHDIGKIGIPDHVLLKNGPLNHEEWQIMKQHCHIGAQILQESGRAETVFWQWRSADETMQRPESGDEVIEMGTRVALTHHERWNGTGYPQGLAGEEIPLESRIVAVSDVFDAMTASRSYRQPLSEQEAIDTILEGAGVEFCPDVCSAFLDALPAIRSVRQRFTDQTPQSEQVKGGDDGSLFVCR